MATIQIGDYSAWICINGDAVTVYNVEGTNKSAMCWIASEVGKNFSVNWYNPTRRVALQAVVTIDGIVCDNHIMLDAQRYPDKPNGVGVSYTRTSDWTRRDFQFSTIMVSDDDAYLDTIDASLNIGAIKLELWRLEVTSVISRPLEHQYGGPVLENQIVHEKSKKAGAHHVTFGDEYASSAPTVDMVQGYTLDQEPLMTFTFKYRPYNVLQANGIIPCPVSSMMFPKKSDVVDPRTEAEIRKLEGRLNALRARAATTSSASPDFRSSRRIKPEPKSNRIPTEIIDLT